MAYSCIMVRFPPNSVCCLKVSSRILSRYWSIRFALRLFVRGSRSVPDDVYFDSGIWEFCSHHYCLITIKTIHKVSSAAKSNEVTLDPLPLDMASGAEMEWNALSSFGSASLQLRKEEEEILLEIQRRFRRWGIGTSIIFLTHHGTRLQRQYEGATHDVFSIFGVVAFGNSMPLSRQEHYSDLSIATNGCWQLVSPNQWMHQFCNEKGGIKLTMMQNGDNVVQPACGTGCQVPLAEEYKETFLAACNAC